ncbi:MAG: ABC transporter ATP-binding protein [Oligoflexia bacterium]|nr:ABC transporter ATP-binding protein [Oligoflexia bacterium]
MEIYQYFKKGIFTKSTFVKEAAKEAAITTSTSTPTPTATPTIKIENLCFAYKQNQKKIFTDLNLKIYPAKLIALLGANGSGKSTLLKLIARILRPSSGNVLIDQMPLSHYHIHELAAKISYYPQSVEQNLSMLSISVEELVAMGAYSHSKDLNKKLFIPTRNSVIQMVGLEEKRHHPLATLSGGEQRRAFLAMFLHKGSRILLLDEPLANLDIKYQIELFHILHKLATVEHFTIVTAIHDLNIAKEMDQVLLLHQGKIIANGDPEKVLSKENLNSAFELTGLIN